MNDVIRQLLERKSVRVYEDREIGETEKQMILEAACQAPTAGNQQLYTILDITDKEKKEALAVLCDNQPFIAKAPLVLIFLADCRKWYQCGSAYWRHCCLLDSYLWTAGCCPYNRIPGRLRLRCRPGSDSGRCPYLCFHSTYRLSAEADGRQRNRHYE